MKTSTQRRLRSSSSDPASDFLKANIRTLIAALRDRLGMEVSFVSRFEGLDRCFLTVSVAESARDIPLDEAMRGRREHSLCHWVATGQLPELIVDVAAIPAVGLIVDLATFPLGAHISVPITFPDGRVYGTLCCFSRAPNPDLTARDVEMLRVFADYLVRDIQAIEAVERADVQERQRLKRTIDHRRFTGRLQPIVYLAESRTVGLEALTAFQEARYHDTQTVFDSAWRLGLGRELEFATMSSLLMELDHVPVEQFISVNLSPRSILDADLPRLLASSEATRIVIELTEHAAIETYDEIRLAIDRLRATGVRLAIDDVGSGFASLQHILRLDPEFVKISADIVSHVGTDRATDAMFASLVGFTGLTGSILIAEGVETEEQVARLLDLGVAYGQGYLLGRPAQRRSASAG